MRIFSFPYTAQSCAQTSPYVCCVRYARHSSPYMLAILCSLQSLVHVAAPPRMSHPSNKCHKGSHHVISKYKTPPGSAAMFTASSSSVLCSVITIQRSSVNDHIAHLHFASAVRLHDNHIVSLPKCHYPHRHKSRQALTARAERLTPRTSSAAS